MSTLTNNRHRILLNSIALGMSFGLVLLPQPRLMAEESKLNGLKEKMEQWQEKMSEKFRDTWKSLRGAQKEKSIGTASVDLREEKDSYILRLNLPDRDLGKVEISLEGDTLKIVAPAGDKANRYEQSVTLAGVAAGAQPKIERRQNDSMIVVAVPKTPTTAETKPSLTLPDPALAPLSEWDADIFARMERMRRDMDRAFDDAFKDFKGDQSLKGFFDEPRFGSSIDLKEEGDNYVVRAYLPDRDMQEVNVTVDNRVLKIQAKAQESKEKPAAGGAPHSTRKAEYSQLLTLPGPVQVEKMKVDRKDAMVIVTLPKAK